MKRTGVLKKSINKYSVLPLRDVVVFPHMIVPLFVGREKSVNALQSVMKENKQVLLIISCLFRVACHVQYRGLMQVI